MVGHPKIKWWWGLCPWTGRAVMCLLLQTRRSAAHVQGSAALRQEVLPLSFFDNRCPAQPKQEGEDNIQVMGKALGLPNLSGRGMDSNMEM